MEAAAISTSAFASFVQALLVWVSMVALTTAVCWGAYKLLQGGHWLASGVFGGVARGVGFVFDGIGMLLRRCGGFVRWTVQDSLRLLGSLLTAAFILPLLLVNFCLLRRGTAAHLARALRGELSGAGVAMYRLAIGNPVRSLGLGALTEGLERRLPAALGEIPARPASAQPLEFEGYELVHELARGGSGAHLFVATTSADRRAAFERAGHPAHERVVLKVFSLEEGSTLPQIVRESRALEAGRRLGLVLDHELTAERFFYAMPYVPGDDLGVVSARMHAASSAEGLDPGPLREALELVCHLLETLDHFHSAGLWHKDIKPSNVIVSSHRAHLVDLGLVTPLRSAMTLTTHGTEYFRDPEMVRQAMRGVKVHEVDGVKFDLYSMGALAFSMIENTIPAHGSLSRIEKRCPEAVRWIVRRAMADVGKRYVSAREMLADVQAVLAASDLSAPLPASLPSMGGAMGQLPAASTGEPLQYAFEAGSSFDEREGEASGGLLAKAGRRRGALAAGILGLTLFLVLDKKDADGRFGPPTLPGVSARSISPMAGPARGSSVGSGSAKRRQRFEAILERVDKGSTQAASTGARELFASGEQGSARIDLPARVGLLLGDVERDHPQGLSALQAARASDGARAERAQVLLLLGLGAELEPNELEQLRATLRAGRVALLDADPGEPGFEIEAELRELLGVRGIEDGGAASELRLALAEHSKELDGVLWVDASPEQEGLLVYRLLAVAGAESELSPARQSELRLTGTASHP